MPKTPAEVEIRVEALTKGFADISETARIYSISAEVHRAIAEARAKHGSQLDVPLGTGPTELFLLDLDFFTTYQLEELPNASLERAAKALTEDAFKNGELTWSHILFEEVAEALAAEGADLRAELLQVAAMAIAMIRALDAQTASA